MSSGRSTIGSRCAARRRSRTRPGPRYRSRRAPASCSWPRRAPAGISSATTANAGSASLPRLARSLRGPGSMAERRAGATRATRKAPRGSAAARPFLRLVSSERRSSTKEAARLARVDLALLFSSAGFLTAVGLIMVLSAGSVSAAQGYGGNSFWYFERQVLYAAVGIGVALVLARMSPRRWRVLGLPLLGVAAVLMAIAARPSSGTALYGASRWIDLGPLTVQPSEIAKLG